MATFRKLHTTFWSDPFVESLSDKQKLFYLYLMSNDKTKQSGIYEISLRQIKFETGFSESEVRELLEFLIDNNKIKWSEQTNEIALGNWSKYNFSNSPKIVKCIQTELLEVKNTLLIKYVYPMDNVSILYPYPIDTPSQEEKEQEEYKEEVQESKTISYTLAKKLLSDLSDWSLSFSMFEEALKEMNSIGFNKLCIIAQITEIEKAKIKECVNIRVEQQN